MSSICGRVVGEFTAKNGARVVVRYVRWEDICDYYELWKSLARDKEVVKYLGVVEEIDFSTCVDRFSRIVASVEKGKEIRLVAEVDGKVVGYVSIKIEGGSFRHRGWLGIIIRREYRDLGIGTRLLEAVVREAKRMGLKLILLETSSLNSRAIHVFRKVGFREIGVVPGGLCIDNKCVDTLFMVLRLDFSEL